MGKKSNEKFKFGIEFQELILKFIATDKLGFKILNFIEDTYFTSLYHQVIVFAIKKYYKKHKRIPEEIYLREDLRSTYEREKIFNTSLTQDDKDQISNLIRAMYDGIISEPDIIIEKTIDFARYVKFKEELENVDINNFDSYENAIGKLTNANKIGIDLQKNYGTFVVAGMKDRAHKRNSSHFVNPTPFKQINQLLNSGGLLRGSVICFLGKEKRFKTGMLVNTARGYLRLRKKIFFADIENGENAITVRAEQSLTKQSQETITSEVYDEKLLKLMRKYARLGAELVIRRFPALTTTCADIQKWLDELKRDFGITFDVGIIDYGLLLASISGKMDEFGRISDSFLDIKNLAETNKFEAIYTAAHITRDGDKRTKTKYQSTDIAKCIDIPRHVDALIGVQENDDEIAQGVMRLEIVEQRNGMREGRALLWVDISKQTATEFNQAEIADYRNQIGQKSTMGKKSVKKTDL